MIQFFYESSFPRESLKFNFLKVLFGMYQSIFFFRSYGFIFSCYYFSYRVILF